MDQTLTDLITAAQRNPSDDMLAVIADRLCEVDGKDRVEVLRKWFNAEQNLASMMGATYRRGGVKFEVRLTVPDRETSNLDELRARTQYAERELFCNLPARIEDDHWYAIRLQRDARTAGWIQATEHRLVLSVAPLDGGRLVADGI